jgi:hypothetical protein
VKGMRIFLTSFVLVAAMATALIADMAAPTIMILGEPCGPGAARQNPWFCFEDRDGNGFYDFVTAGDCNGDVRGRPMRVNEKPGDPFAPMPGDTRIGKLPPGTFSKSAELITAVQPDGSHTWAIVERDGAGLEVCRTTRNLDMSFGCTCPSDENDDGDLK